VRGDWWGFLGFDDVEAEREWTDEDVGLLQTAAVVLGAFIERGMANEALQAAHQQLLQTEKMATIGALVAGVAHEINTPLGAISSMHDTLVRGVAKLESAVDSSDPGVTKALAIVHDANQVIRSATSRVLEIVRRLKDFARYDQGELERVDLHEELTDTLSLAHHELKHGVEVHQNLGQVPAVEGYANQIDQVFLNLVVNAKQAMGVRGNLWISTAPVSAGVEVRVEDDGPGIDDDKLEAIFAPGFTTKKKGAGLGLGLAICQQIVAKHHGRIRAENRPEGGARFVVWLPVDQPEGEADTQPAEPASTSDRLDFAARHPDGVSDSPE
jgi:signal transduction histidine kinase